MPNLCAQQGAGMIELTGAVEMDGSLCRVNRAIAEYRSVSTKPAIAGRLRQVPQPKVCCGRGKEWYFLPEMTQRYFGLIISNI